jgi:hypothetical protein
MSRKVIVKPTPEGYARAVMIILRRGSNTADINWAEQQIISAFQVAAQLNPEEWAPQTKESKDASG